MPIPALAAVPPLAVRVTEPMDSLFWSPLGVKAVEPVP